MKMRVMFFILGSAVVNIVLVNGFSIKYLTMPDRSSLKCTSSAMTTFERELNSVTTKNISSLALPSCAALIAGTTIGGMFNIL